MGSPTELLVPHSQSVTLTQPNPCKPHGRTKQSGPSLSSVSLPRYSAHLFQADNVFVVLYIFQYASALQQSLFQDSQTLLAPKIVSSTSV